MTQHDTQSGERRARRHPFKRRDLERAMKSARAEGMEISAIEVVCKDGTVIRVLGNDVKREGSGGDLDHWIATRGKDARPD